MAVSPKIRDVPPVTVGGFAASHPDQSAVTLGDLRLHPCYLPRIQRREKRLQKQFRPFCTGSYARPIGRLHPALRQRDRLDFRPAIPRPRKNILDRSQRCRAKLLWTGKCIDYPFGEICRFETMGKKSAESTLSGVLLRDHECRELVYAQQLRTVRPPDYIRRRYHH